MSKEVIYTGIEIDHDELIRLITENNPMYSDFNHLEKAKGEYHVTLRFRPKPDDILEELFGTEVKVHVIGYGIDANNEGLLVELYPITECPPSLIGQQGKVAALNDILRSVETPHITLSTSAKGLAKNTKNLHFWPLAKPFFIKGVYMGYDGKGNKVMG